MYNSSFTAEFDPALVVAPFVAIVREPYLAGPYKLIALDTIQTLLSCNTLQGCTNASDTLTEIVDAVTRYICGTVGPHALLIVHVDVGANLCRLTSLATI